MASRLQIRWPRGPTWLAVLGLVLARPLRAQDPRTPTDSVRPAATSSDSAPRRPIDSPMMLVAIPAGIAAAAALFFAPAPLALVLHHRDTTHAAFRRDERAVAMALGGTFHGGQTWAHAIGLETFRGNVHAEAAVEDFWRPRHIEYVSARVSYLWHPRQLVAGGVSLGYMRADIASAQRGVELGLPLLLAGTNGGDVRFEPTYTLGQRGIVFNYRLQLRAPIARSRYFAGASLVAKGNPPPQSAVYPGDFTATGVMLLFGSRF